MQKPEGEQCAAKTTTQPSYHENEVLRNSEPLSPTTHDSRAAQLCSTQVTSPSKVITYVDTQAPQLSLNLPLVVLLSP